MYKDIKKGISCRLIVVAVSNQNDELDTNKNLYHSFEGFDHSGKGGRCGAQCIALPSTAASL